MLTTLLWATPTHVGPDGANWVNVLRLPLLEREIRAIEHIRRRHPRFAATPFMNNECDPQVGWGDFHTWHARPYYAAIVCKIISQHLEE